jgi:carbamoyl-phosphate synthase large subunit
MPRRDDIHKILIIGSGPIVIGQACEFDYSGAQACKALMAEGYELVLINSNPATIMTDPIMAQRTYIEPIDVKFIEMIIERERPDAILPTLGGQTALNCAMDVARLGILEKYNVKMLGASVEAIAKAEDRELFKKCMQKIGLDLPKSELARTIAEAEAALEVVGLPAIIRPAFTLGGKGGGVAFNMEQYRRYIQTGLDASPIKEILVEEYLAGWKEFELEVMRDRMDNVVIICSIENIDPMGIHTGDSITVAPAQTLTDREYQEMRNAAIKVIREIGVETGGSNVQFAVNPANGRMVVIEINPRVSRSSALASKATGFPIAKIAAKLAVGYTLDEIPNDITAKTPACFEPSIDYCAVKIPRFTFEKFKGAEPILGSSMKSVGEAMALGRTFKEALQKGMRSLEIGVSGLTDTVSKVSDEQLRQGLIMPVPDRLFYVKEAIKRGMKVEEVAQLSTIDRWFVHNIKQIVDMEAQIVKAPALTAEFLLEAKKYGFSDRQIAQLRKSTEQEIRTQRIGLGVKPVYKLVDTCAAEFEAYTPYYYSTYETTDESIAATEQR